MRVTISQFAGQSEKSANLASIRGAAETAARNGSDLLVLPEGCMATHQHLADVRGSAEPVTGPFVTALADLAAEYGIWMLGGVWESDGGATYNTQVGISPVDGAVATYRKVHLYDAFGFRESEFVTPAAVPAPAVLDCGFAKVGMITCYDLRFPESARLVVDAGADVLAVPAAWIPGANKVEHWVTLARARAIENTVFVLGADQPLPVGVGHSLVVNPSGDVVAELGSAAGTLTVDIDVEAISSERQRNPSLANRRLVVRARA